MLYKYETERYIKYPELFALNAGIAVFDIAWLIYNLIRGEWITAIFWVVALSVAIFAIYTGIGTREKGSKERNGRN